MSPRVSQRVSQKFPPQMFVDGYNIVGAWQQLKDLRDNLGLESARGSLIETMTNFSAYHGYDTTLVFDAYNIETPGVSEKVTKNLRLYFTEHRQTADTYIERVCGQLHRDPLRHQKRLIVVTSDRAQQLTAIGFGAEWLSANALEQEVAHTLRSVLSRQKPQKASAKTIGNIVDSETRERLSRLRRGLDT
jgi:uncharacterized protein